MLIQGDRFGGALDGAARQFSQAYDTGTLPMEFVNDTRKQHKLIMGIGHRVKSVMANLILVHSLHLITLISSFSPSLTHAHTLSPVYPIPSNSSTFPLSSLIVE